MQFSRTLLAASLALLITGQAPLYAAPPLSMDNGTAALTGALQSWLDEQRRSAHAHDEDPRFTRGEPDADPDAPDLDDPDDPRFSR